MSDLNLLDREMEDEAMTSSMSLNVGKGKGVDDTDHALGAIDLFREFLGAA